mgnify:CR=1 FL=1
MLTTCLSARVCAALLETIGQMLEVAEAPLRRELVLVLPDVVVDGLHFEAVDWQATVYANGDIPVDFTLPFPPAGYAPAAWGEPRTSGRPGCSRGPLSATRRRLPWRREGYRGAEGARGGEVGRGYRARRRRPSYRAQRGQTEYGVRRRRASYRLQRGKSGYRARRWLP